MIMSFTIISNRIIEFGIPRPGDADKEIMVSNCQTFEKSIYVNITIDRVVDKQLPPAVISYYTANSNDDNSGRERIVGFISETDYEYLQKEYPYGFQRLSSDGIYNEFYNIE